jgi:hypothetical protein
MANAQLKLPKDPNSEIYFDANRLVVDFRKREAKRTSLEGRSKVLRVVIQCFGWVIEDKFFQPGTPVTVGSGKSNVFRIPTRDLPENHALFDYGQDGSIQLSVNRHFTGVVQMGDELKDLNDLVSDKNQNLQVVTLKSGSKGCIEHGTLRFYFEEIPDPERVPPVAIFKNWADPHFFKWVLSSLALHLILLLVVKMWPVPTKEVTLEQLPQQFKKILIQTPQVKAYVPKAMSMQSGTRGKQGMEGEGARAPGPEGRRGRGVPGAGARVSNRDINKTGVLDVFTRKGKTSAFSELLGGGSGVPSNVDQAFNRAARYGLPGERELREGKGLQGSGTGGGGLSTSIGSGLGTKGTGGGAKGPGLADFGTGRSDTAVSASIDEEEVFIMGNIPKEVIAKIISDNMGQIRFCYQRQLQLQPNLRGKIVTDFIIGLEGSVTSAHVAKSSMGSPPVESCVVGVLRRLRFPKPGGGVVEVKYPFSFRVAG